MACSNPRFVGIHDDFDLPKPRAFASNNPDGNSCNNEGTLQVSKSRSKISPQKSFKSFKRKMGRVFSEDYEFVMVKNIFDPHGPAIHLWNKVFLVVCIVSLFVDPLFFFLPHVWDIDCVDHRILVEDRLTVIRSIADVFYVIHIFLRFRTAYVAPSSRVFGRGELVIEPVKISSRYLSRGFWLDLIAALPIPQFVIWVLIPNLDSTMTDTKHVLLFAIFFQYLPRLFLIFPLSSQIVKTSGAMTENAWGGAAYNLMLYILASHVIGAVWYVQAVVRQEACWRAACNLQSPSCQNRYFECQSIDDSRNAWYQQSNLTDICSPTNNMVQFGIYADAVSNEVTSAAFIDKYFYSFFWGLKNLSCLGQNLLTSPDIAENIFAIIVAVLGLVLFGLLIGNMQTYLLSTTARFEQWRVNRTDTEKWMHHRQLPPDLKQCVRQYHVRKWVANQGVDEEALLSSLPMDLRKDIKRHLCFDLIREVPLFNEMDERMLDAICERLRPRLCTQGTCLVREMDPVKEMVFFIRGKLDSTATGGGRVGFFNQWRLGPGDFCGEELLTWALDPSQDAALPLSTRTVKAVTEVEAFSLVSDDLRFVAGQFRRLHSKQLRHKSRFYSHQWRAWAACYIQDAWRRYRRRRMAAAEEEEVKVAPAAEARAAMFVARLKARRSMRRKGCADVASPESRIAVMPPVKPSDPDFSTVELC